MIEITSVIVVILINILVFVLPSIVDFGKGAYSSFEVFLEKGWKDNISIKSGEFYRLITSIFLHSDIFHLISNMWGLWIFGRGIAEFSPLFFIIVFLFSGILGNLFSFFFNPYPSVGASGGVFGLVSFIITISIIQPNGGLSVIFDLILYIIISFVFATTPHSRIDIWGHLGGLLGGFLVALSLFFL